ncbi:MAG: DNA-deoxyinosine glycosylase [Candidatus Omnitrophica bacterium]|nr:DNA-deoxyinosine glycosylase [Candidatus Omnitrophota bacterium]
MAKKAPLKGLPPIVDRSSRVLVLGSFPSIISREKREYYAHPRNYFWEIIAGVVGERTPVTYRRKKALLKKHKIGLWDIVGSCYLEGTQDSMIRGPALNDIAGLLIKYPNIKAVFLGGKKAYSLFKRRYPALKVPCECLPSTSPANAGQSLGSKKSEWEKIIRINNKCCPSKR